MDHWRTAKKVMRYLQGYMLMYRQTDNLDVVVYYDADFISCVSHKSTYGYIFIQPMELFLGEVSSRL